MRIIPYLARHFDDVDRLWRLCFPNDPPRKRAASAIPTKLALADGLFFVAEAADGRAVGTAIAGYDGHRGWLYAVAVHPDSRLTGIGTALVNHACDALRERGCAKVNLQVREGNEAVVRFYERLGFGCEPRVSMGRELAPERSADHQ